MRINRKMLMLWIVIPAVAMGLGCGCPLFGPPAAGVLEGDWKTTDEDGNNSVVRFDEDGVVVGILTQNEDGDFVLILVDNATTELDGSAVTIIVPTPLGNAIFVGTLSEDENTMTGILGRRIELGDDLIVVIPEGELTLERITDICDVVTCDAGEVCVDGVCVPGDPCEGVTCEDDEVCEDGVCVPVDPCEGVTCEEDEVCMDGECVPQAFTNADSVNGGIMYDTFWASESTFDQDDPNLAIFDASSDFFRCKQCHGWDQLGTAASYIDRAPTTTRPNVSALDVTSVIASNTVQELFDGIKTGSGATRRAVSADLSTYDPDADPPVTEVGDQMPDFGEILTDAQIWDLVKFLKEKALDTTLLYDTETTGTYPTGSRTFSDVGKDGDAANGDAVYAADCAVCHGADGTGTPIAPTLGGRSMGEFARDKPYELQHKSRFGQLGSVMGPTDLTAIEVKDLLKALSDTTTFPDEVD